MIETLCKVVTASIVEVQQQGNDPCVVFADLLFVNRIRIACGCLSVIRSLWVNVQNRSDGRTSSGIDQIKTILLSPLARMVFGATSLWFNEARTEFAQTGQRLCFCLVSLCLELLTFEMEWTCKNQPPVGPDQPVVLALQTAMDQQLPRFVGQTSKFLTLGSLVHYASLLNKLAANRRIGSVWSWTARLHALSQADSLFGVDHFSEYNGYDIFTSTGYLGSFFTDTGAGVDVITYLREVAVSRSLLDSEKHRILSWQVFSKSFAHLVQNWRSQSSSHPLLISMSSSSFALEASHEILRAMYDNLIHVELTQLEGLPSIPSKEIVAVAGASSSLLLHFAVETISGDAWSEIIGLLSECTSKFVSVLGARISVSPVDQCLLECRLVTHTRSLYYSSATSLFSKY
jgi:hypothetical protein